MEAAAVPVIVADDLELPLGPSWEEFSLRVREQDVDDIPGLIERSQHRAIEMGLAARRAWKAYFSPQATVGSLVGWAQQLLKHPRSPPALLRIEEYTSPPLVRAKLRRVLSRRLHPANASGFQRVMHAVMPMNIAALRRAYDGK
jgi:hypothetical protein